jgi:Uma2 family endonuclease
MALTVGDRDVRPLTVDEVMRMVEAGILAEPERLELLHGALTEKPVKSPAHEAIKSRVLEWLQPGWGRLEYLVRTAGPLTVRDRLSLPEPDIAVVEPRDYLAHHPDRAHLVVEVAASSLNVDLGLKRDLYAGAGVTEYWVVDVPDRQLHVFRDPQGLAYVTSTVHRAPDALTPVGVAAPPLALAKLFHGV